MKAAFKQHMVIHIHTWVCLCVCVCQPGCLCGLCVCALGKFTQIHQAYEFIIQRW